MALIPSRKKPSPVHLGSSHGFPIEDMLQGPCCRIGLGAAGGAETVGATGVAYIDISLVN